jgi:MFS family permease
MSTSSRPSIMLMAVCAIGITQITAWGTSYYCLGVLAAPITDELEWSRSFVFFGFTVALLVMGAISTPIGKLIDRQGARLVMCSGTLIVSVGLATLANVTAQWTYLLTWAVLGVGMRMCLYDAAFAAVVQVAPSKGRQAISYLTLFGAFASSVFWTLGHHLNEAVGWRETLIWFSLINLTICLPLNWLGLSRREPANVEPSVAQSKQVTQERPPLEGGTRRIAMCLFALVMSLNGFVFGVVSVQLVPLLESAGLATAAAVGVASIKGFAQFGGRVVEIIFGRNFRAMTIARIAVGVLPVSVIILLGASGNFAALVLFTLVMGASQGVITIVRGAVPLALFGPKGYGAVLGLIATPILIVNATAPTLFALIIDKWDWRTAELVLLFSCTAAWIAMELMSRWYERTGTGGPSPTGASPTA